MVNTTGLSAVRAWARALRHPWPLAVWLFMLALACMCPLVWVSGQALVEAVDADRQALRKDRDHRGAQIAQLLEENLLRQTQALEALGRSEAAREGRWPELYEEARFTAERLPGLQAISVVSPVDEVVFVTSLPFGSKTFAPNFPDLIEQARRLERSNVSGLFTTPISDRQLICLTVPVRRVDGQIYVLRGIVWVETLNQLLKQAQLPAGWVAGLADRQGVLVARNVEPERFTGRRVPDSFVQAIRAGGTVRFEGTTLSGLPVTSIAIPIHRGDWTLAVGAPVAELEAPLRARLSRLLWVMAVGLGLALGLSIALSRWLVLQFRQTAQQLGDPLSGHVEPFRPRVRELRSAMEVHGSLLRELREEQRMRRHWQAQNDELSGLLHAGPCGDMVLDAEGRVLRINQTLCNGLGWPLDEALGRSFLEVIEPSQRTIFVAECQACEPDRGTTAIDLTLLRSDGSPLEAMLILRAEPTAGEKPGVIRAAVIDISERKSMERALLRRLDHTPSPAAGGMATGSGSGD